MLRGWNLCERDPRAIGGARLPGGQKWIERLAPGYFTNMWPENTPRTRIPFCCVPPPRFDPTLSLSCLCQREYFRPFHRHASPRWIFDDPSPPPSPRRFCLLFGLFIRWFDNFYVCLENGSRRCIACEWIVIFIFEGSSQRRTIRKYQWIV